MKRFHAAFGLVLCASSASLLFIAGCGGLDGVPVSGRPSVSSSPATVERSGAGPTAEESRSSADAMWFDPESSDSSSFESAPTADGASGFGGPAESAPAISRSESVSVSDESVAPTKEKPFVPQNGRQSGVLTAGSFDDVANFSAYLDFLTNFRCRTQHQYQQLQSSLPVQPQTQQTLITVTDGQGRPVTDARCVVTSGDRKLLDLRTGSDGRVTLLSPRASVPAGQQQPLRLQVFPSGQSAAVFDEFQPVACAWNVVLDQAASVLPKQLDLALVIDTTGSMGDELEYLKTEIDSIAAAVNRMFPDVDQRYALVTYRDNGDEYVTRSFDFSGSLSDFRMHLDEQSANGGGDFPEAMDAALENSLQLSWRQTNTARVLFLVGDAPPHPEKASRTMHCVQQLREQGVRMFPVGASGMDKTAEVLMRTASLLTMGQYLFLTDHSGIGNPHATPDVPQFAVERLDRLMIRMIASELAGKRLVPEEVIAIEHGERYSYAAPICTPIVRRPPFCATADMANVHNGFLKTLALSFRVWVGHYGLAALAGVIACVLTFESLQWTHWRRCRLRR
ncbi:MAG: vWA domain-containing protein [Planctomycetaceae bacterium]